MNLSSNREEGRGRELEKRERIRLVCSTMKAAMAVCIATWQKGVSFRERTNSVKLSSDLGMGEGTYIQ